MSRKEEEEGKADLLKKVTCTKPSSSDLLKDLTLNPEDLLKAEEGHL